MPTKAVPFTEQPLCVSGCASYTEQACLIECVPLRSGKCRSLGRYRSATGGGRGNQTGRRPVFRASPCAFGFRNCSRMSGSGRRGLPVGRSRTEQAITRRAGDYAPSGGGQGAGGTGARGHGGRNQTMPVRSKCFSQLSATLATPERHFSSNGLSSPASRSRSVKTRLPPCLVYAM